MTATRLDPSLPRLRELLEPISGAKLARLIGCDRSYVHRLRRGQPLTDLSLVDPIADAIKQDRARVRAIVENDARRTRIERSARRRSNAA